MDRTFFSDRELGPAPRVHEAPTQEAWGGVMAAVRARVSDGSFGYTYPLLCPDNLAPYGCDEETFSLALRGEVPEIHWPLDPSEVPPLAVTCDLIEFCFRCTAKPIPRSRHQFFGHTHLAFDQALGIGLFLSDINSVFARNGLAFELTREGRIERIPPGVLREALMQATFRTGDSDLDTLLEGARRKFLDPSTEVRRESLEKLWDAWERLKTIEQGKGKPESIAILLEKASPERTFRATLDGEARELTRIGNTFRIRHSETTQVPLEHSEYIDYLFIDSLLCSGCCSGGQVARLDSSPAVVAHGTLETGARPLYGPTS